jgi:hypothetical protein
MGQKVTLGGERLGSGSKMKVELHGYERSTHDLGYLWRSTMSAGTLVPFLSEVALPADTFDIHLEVDIKTHPTIGPLFGGYKVQLDVFQCPIRLYQGQLHNNKLGIGMHMANIKLPTMRLQAFKRAEGQDLDNFQINPSCILSYLGLRGIGYIPAADTDDTGLRTFNALPLIAYWDIYKNYYANKQEEIGAVIHRPAITIETTVDNITISGAEVNPGGGVQPPAYLGQNFEIIINYTGTEPIPEQILFNTTVGQYSAQQFGTVLHDTANSKLIILYDNRYGTIYVTSWQYINRQSIPATSPIVATFNLQNIDQTRENILRFATEGSDPFNLNDNNDSLTPMEWLINSVSDSQPPFTNTQEGLGIKTYQSDLFNNWLSTEWIDGAEGISEVTAIDTTGGSFTIDTLNLSKKVYNMLNRIAVSGGSYDDWLDAVYDHNRIQRAETPIYHGGLIRELVFQEVVSNSATSTGETASQPLGTLAGKGTMGHKKKGGTVTIKVDEPSYIIGIISLTPRIDYSQGNKWDLHLETMDDLHKPALDEIGFQELITEQMAWWSTTKNPGANTWTTKSAGKQPAWINYMTNVNQVRGNFAIQDNEMFMTLNRRYEQETDNWGIADMTTYIDPTKYNQIFAQTAIDAQNFWAQIAVDIEARRKMSAKIMPNL